MKLHEQAEHEIRGLREGQVWVTPAPNGRHREITFVGISSYNEPIVRYRLIRIGRKTSAGGNTRTTVGFFLEWIEREGVVLKWHRD